MPFSCKVGDSFYLSDAGGRHRYVIITQPNDNGDVVVVNFTDARNIDCNLTFTPQDDGRLFKIPTTVYYAYARTMSAQKLSNITIDGYQPCRTNNINKIIEGAFQNLDTPLYIIEELKNQYPSIYKSNFTWDYSSIYNSTLDKPT